MSARFVLGVVVLLVACGRAPAPAAGPASASPRRDLCAGLGDAACEERLMAQSFCLVAPDGAACGGLREAGWIPPAPPPLASLMRCWRVDEARADLPASWWCLGERDVALRGRGGWEVWSHGGWRREDTVERAGWTVELAGGDTLWIAVTAAAPATLHVSDGGGRLSAALVAGEPASAGEVAAQRAALPAIARVCAAARACQVAMPRPPRTGAEIEAEIEGEVDDPVAGAVTLSACLGAWRETSARLAATGAPVPPACGTRATSTPRDWADEHSLAPPFADPESAVRWW